MSIAIRSNTNTMKGWTFACFNITDRQIEFSSQTKEDGHLAEGFVFFVLSCGSCLIREREGIKGAERRKGARRTDWKSK